MSTVKKKTEAAKPEGWTLTQARRAAAVEFCRKANLLKWTNELIEQTGVIGERKNRLLLWLVFTSSLRDRPLHVISLGGSGTGKTYLQEKIADLIPHDQKLEVTAVLATLSCWTTSATCKAKKNLPTRSIGRCRRSVIITVTESWKMWVLVFK